MLSIPPFSFTLFFFFFKDTATTEIYTLSLHDALPISPVVRQQMWGFTLCVVPERTDSLLTDNESVRSEEHTSELQSPYDLVCRLLLEKKKKKKSIIYVKSFNKLNTTTQFT